MRLPLLRRMLNVAALGTGVALAAFTASPAHAGVEVGATAGLHVFSINNELGVPDTVKATSLRNSALFGLRLGFMFNDMIGVEAEAGIIPSEDRNLVYDVFTGTVRGHVIAQFRAANPANKLVPFAVLGGGATKVLSSDREDRIDLDTDAALYVGVGAKYRVENGWGLRADGRLMLPPSSKNESAALDGEILLSVYKEFGRKEAPKGEEPLPPVEEDKDPDKDGILGDADGCPTDAEDADGFEDENGCPDPDNDADNVLDASDQCPSDPEDADGFKDEDGCPDPDNDGDGIADGTDQCPAEPEDADGFEDENGCPDPDNDGDGVLDAADTCPDKMETKNGYQDGDGCPDEVPAALAKFTGVIKGINFKTGSAEILKTSNKILDKAVKVMQDYPDIKLEIQGHTDDVGDDAANLDLSQKRAESVKAYFEGKGIAADRVSAKGYGETAPSAPIDGLKGGKLKAAQAKNRRVEFKLLSDLQQ
ncbi:MAG: OmpA family protein [Myxococcales bacterium]|nr:OmpA family protein [Myxococcales bacterium]MBK7197915.1 OmpA family protein [Myxococcales bacterium]MBP6844976.1 OmpA family protein [Kofleriaceae bacterium]